MEQSIKVRGILTLAPIKKPIEAGSLAVYDHEDGSGLQVGTVEHLDSDNRYYLIGTMEGYTPPDPVLYRFIVIDDMKNEWPLKFNDWYKVVKNKIPRNTVDDFFVTPLKFREGKYSQCCSECHSYFLGSKTQPYCKGCCEELAYASLTLERKQVKEKRPRLIQPAVVDMMLIECYRGGVEGISWEEISKRVKEKLANGSYRT